MKKLKSKTVATSKEGYLIEKGLKPDSKFGKLYIVSSNREGATLKTRDVWSIEKGPTRGFDRIKVSSKRYILKDEFPYEVDIFDDEAFGSESGFGSGQGDLWAWSYFAYLDEKKAVDRLYFEKEQIAIKYNKK